MGVSSWKIYTKANKPGWTALIPIYNIIILLDIINKPTWWAVLFFIPGGNIIMTMLTNYLLSKSFGKTELFTIGLVLVPIIFYPILAFGDSKYSRPASLDTN